MSTETILTFCGNLAYSISREADESTPYILEEHEEQPYVISVVIRYIRKTEHQVTETEHTLTLDSEEVMNMKIEGDFKELGIQIRSIMSKFRVGKRITTVQKMRMVNDFLDEICDHGVGYCRCYCDLSTGPKIVMEIVELLNGDNSPPALDY